MWGHQYLNAISVSAVFGVDKWKGGLHTGCAGSLYLRDHVSTLHPQFLQKPLCYSSTFTSSSFHFLFYFILYDFINHLIIFQFLIEFAVSFFPSTLSRGGVAGSLTPGSAMYLFVIKHSPAVLKPGLFLTTSSSDYFQSIHSSRSSSSCELLLICVWILISNLDRSSSNLSALLEQSPCSPLLLISSRQSPIQLQ